MTTIPEFKEEKYYLAITGKTPAGEKLVAEYDTRNNNLRIYVYTGDTITEAYYDDDNDGKVETYFLNNVSFRRKEPSSERKRRGLLLSLLTRDKSYAQELDDLFKEKDFEFRNYKRLLSVNNVLAGKKVLSSAQVLEDLFK